MNTRRIRGRQPGSLRPALRAAAIAVDFSGRSLELHQHQDTYYCPWCKDGILDDKGVSGPHQMHTYACPKCGVTWKSGTNLPRNVKLVMM